VVSLTYTRDELRDLAHRKRRSAVIRWLDERAIPYILDADLWPKVLRGAILGATSRQPAEPQLRLQ